MSGRGLWVGRVLQAQHPPSASSACHPVPHLLQEARSNLALEQPARPALPADKAEQALRAKLREALARAERFVEEIQVQRPAGREGGGHSPSVCPCT